MDSDIRLGGSLSHEISNVVPSFLRLMQLCKYVYLVIYWDKQYKLVRTAGTIARRSLVKFL